MNDKSSRTDNSDAAQAPRVPPRWTKRSLILRLIVVAVTIPILVWSYRGAEMDPADLVKHADNLYEYARGFTRPDFAYWRVILREMTVTVQIAICGSFAAVVLAVPCSLMAASNLAPAWLRQPFRRIMDLLRSVHAMIFALFFITTVGMGPFAGVLAIFANTLGNLAKLFSEATEAIDSRPVEGIRATGANRLQQIGFGVIPQVVPLWISYSLYRFESNVRSASVLGLVGAGGIGFVLWEAIRGFRYSKTAAIVLVIVATVSVLDFFSAWIRKRFI